MSTFEIIRRTHLVSVVLFMLIYMIKTFLISANKNEALASFTKIFKIPEMVISLLFFASGIYMVSQLPEINMMMVAKLAVVLIAIPTAIIGFKKSNKKLAQLSLFMIVAAYGLAEMSKNHLSHTEKEAINTAGVDGAKIYSAMCVSCHGADGKLGLLGAKDLTASVLSHDDMKLIISKGKGAMTSFKHSMTEEQISAVAAYVEILKK